MSLAWKKEDMCVCVSKYVCVGVSRNISSLAKGVCVSGCVKLRGGVCVYMCVYVLVCVLNSLHSWYV